jgi:hypothetical protein
MISAYPPPQEVGFSKPSYDEPEGGEPILGHWGITSLVEALVTTNGALVKRRLLLLTLLDNRFVRVSIWVTLTIPFLVGPIFFNKAATNTKTFFFTKNLFARWFLLLWFTLKWYPVAASQIKTILAIYRLSTFYIIYDYD